MEDGEKVVLEDSDLDTLGEERYLSDQVIAFYLIDHLSCNPDNNATKLVTPSISHWIANCKDGECVKSWAQSCEILSKRVVLFVVNDSDGGNCGSHWSTLVYDRVKNLFLHFDSSKGANSFYAEKLYDAVKEHMGPGGEVAGPSLKKKQKNKKKGVQSAPAPAPAGLPVFEECESAPQQVNGSDCGLYVLAIAREICQWCSNEHKKSDMISTIKKNVDSSVE